MQSNNNNNNNNNNNRSAESGSKSFFSRPLIKIPLIIFTCLLSLLLLLTALLPTIISSKWGNDTLVSYINQYIPGRLSAEKISINWLGPQELHQIDLKDPQGEIILSLKKGSTQSSLFHIFFNEAPLANASIESLNGMLSTDINGNTNIEKALNKHCCYTKSSETTKPITILLKNVNAYFNLDSSTGDPLTLHLIGDTLQNTQSGKFEIDAQLKGLKFNQLKTLDQQSLDTLLTSGQAEIKMNANIVNFPSALVDQFLAIKHPQLAGIVQEFLGQQLNVTLNQTTLSKELEFIFNVKSEHISAAAEFAVKDIIELKKPLIANFKITPELISKLSSAVKSPIQWKLKEPTSAELIVDSFQYPLHLSKNQSFENLDLIPLILNGKLRLSSAALNGGGIAFDIQQLLATVQFEAEKPEGIITLNGEAQYQGKPTSIHLNATIRKPNKLSNLFNDIFHYVSFQGDLKGLPVGVIDAQSNLNQKLVDLVGNSLDVSVSSGLEKNKPVANVRLKSDFIDIPNLTFILDNDIVLNKPAIAKVYISPQLINSVLSENNAEGQYSRLKDIASATIKLNKLSLSKEALFPTTSNPPYFPDVLFLDADIALSTVTIQHPAVGIFSMNDFNVHISGTPLSHAKLIASGTILQKEAQGIIYDVLGEEVKIGASTQLKLPPQYTPGFNEIILNISSPLAQANITGALEENARIVLTQPAVIKYTLTAPALKALGISSIDNFFVQHKTPLEFRIAKSKIPLNDNDLSSMSVSGDVNINDLSLRHRLDQSIPSANLDHLTLRWMLDAAAQVIRIDFDGATRLGQQEDQGAITGNATIDHWSLQGKTLDLNQAIAHFKAKAFKIPATFLGAFIRNTDLTPLIGASFETNIAADIPLGSKNLGTLALDLRSDLLAGTAHFKLNNGISLSDPNKPAQFNITLTPGGYTALRQYFGETTSNFSLAEPTQINLQLRALNVPNQLTSSKTLALWKSAIYADLFIDKLSGVDTKSNKITLNGIKGHLSSDDISQHTAFELYAEGTSISNQQTSLNIAGSLEKGFSETGSLNRHDLSLNFDATLTNLPLPLMCQFVCPDPSIAQKIDATIGSTFNANIKANFQQMNGPLYIEMRGDHGHTILDGRLYQGALTLNKNFYAELIVTPQLGKHVLQDLIPFLSGIMGSDQPLKLTIAKEGFSLPLRQLDIENVSIGSASLEFGKVRFSNDGQLAKVLSLLTTASANEIMVWLTPAYFSLNQGEFVLQRVDMLISDRYPIAAWGRVSIPNDNVNMIIGLSGAAISRAFSVPGIKKGFMLQLPLKGTMKNTSLDKSKAIARLSALVAQSQGGPQGTVIGTVLDIASGGFNEQTPPPTTNPLPWSNIMEESSDGSGSKTPVDEINKIIPIEEIGKGAGSILKKIFKKD